MYNKLNNYIGEKTKYKNKIIRVEERQYDVALMILNENGIFEGIDK